MIRLLPISRARLMGFNPGRVSYLAQAAEFLGNGTTERIQHLGESLPRSVRPFRSLARVCAPARGRAVDC